VKARECPPEETLGAFLRGELPEPDAARIEQHLEECGECAFVLSSVTARGSGRHEELVDASEMSTKEVLFAPELAPTRGQGPDAARRKDYPSLGARYRVDAFLARGGMGEVYRAYDCELSRTVAVKVIAAGREDRADALERFRREVSLASIVTHANVLRVYDMGEHRGLHFLSMQLVNGHDLGEILRGEGPLSVGRALALFRQICEGVAAAHAGGVLHRDLKPKNVLVDEEDRVYVSDFGLARSLDGPPSRVGRLLGTPAYMSPEQVRGEELDARSDLYALGVLLFELLTGRVPFRGRTPKETMELRLAGPAPRLGPTIGDAPPRLEATIARCTEPDRDKRFATVRELIVELESWSARPSVATHAPISWTSIVSLALLVSAAAVAINLDHGASSASSVAEPTDDEGRTPPLVLELTHHRRVTFGEGCEEYPSFTPDGRYVVYDAPDGFDSHIFALDLDGNTPVRAVTKAHGLDMMARVSPRGDRVAFLREAGGAVATYVAPLDGSAPARLLGKGNGRPSWSRDGRSVWSGAGARIVEYDADTGDTLRSLTAQPGANGVTTAELADGSLAYVAVDGTSHKGEVGVFDAAGEADVLLRALLAGATLVVTPDERHAIVARLDLGAAGQLYDVPLDGSPPASLAGSGVAVDRGVALSQDGRRIAWSTGHELSSPSRVERGGRVVPLPDGAGMYALEMTSAPAAGGRVAIVSSRTGKYEPWLFDPTGGSPPELAAVGIDGVREFQQSPDGTRFLVAVEGAGVYVGSFGEANPRRLTWDPADSRPTFRFGGRQALFTRHLRDGTVQTWSVPLDGGEATPFLEANTGGANPSPVDDRVVYLHCPTAAECEPMIWDGRTGARRRLSPLLVPGYYGVPRFSPDGRRVAMERADTELLEIDAFSGAILQSLQTAGDCTLRDPAYGPTGLIVLGIQSVGDLWVADVTP
jgi:serine/threonine protein kinase